MASLSTSEYNPDNLISGSQEINTKPVEVASGSTVVELEVLGQVLTTGQYIKSVKTATDGSQVPAAISASAVDATAGAVSAPVYVAGAFDPDSLVWDASWSAADRLTAFVNSPINLKNTRYSG